MGWIKNRLGSQEGDDPFPSNLEMSFKSLERRTTESLDSLYHGPRQSAFEAASDLGAPRLYVHDNDYVDPFCEIGFKSGTGSLEIEYIHTDTINYGAPVPSFEDAIATIEHALLNSSLVKAKRLEDLPGMYQGKQH